MYLVGVGCASLAVKRLSVLAFKPFRTTGLNAVFGDEDDSWLMMAKPGGRLIAKAFGNHEPRAHDGMSTINGAGRIQHRGVRMIQRYAWYCCMGASAGGGWGLSTR